MFFMLYTLIPLILSFSIVAFMIWKFRSLKMILILSVFCFGMYFFLSEPAVFKWYFANLPHYLTYFSRPLINAFFIYSLIAFLIIGTHIAKSLPQKIAINK